VRQRRTPPNSDEREGIVLAVSSAFRKLKNLYSKIEPIFEDFGFTPPSAGVIQELDRILRSSLRFPVEILTVVRFRADDGGRVRRHRANP
jgi:hypothetical protein